MEQSVIDKIIDFFELSIPNIHTVDARRAFIYGAISDKKLRNQINFDVTADQFFKLLIPTLVDYGTSIEGQDMVTALLEAAKTKVGIEGQEICDTLLQEWNMFRQKQTDTNEIESRDFKYDVFLSYNEDYEFWVNDPFLPEFRRLLENSLGRRPRILSVRQDDIWTQELKTDLMCSWCVVPIWSPSCFESSWYTYECSVMLERECQLKKLRPENPIWLILPVIVSDGKHFPELAQSIPEKCKLDSIHDFILPGPAIKGSPIYINFRDKVKRWIETAVAEVIKQKCPYPRERLDTADITITQHPISESEQSKQVYDAIWGRRHG